MKKICVVGAGAVGGNIAVRLANSGNEITVIARGANAEAIRQRGLVLKMPGATLSAHPRVCENMREAGEHEVVFVAVKAHSLAEIADDLPSLCGPDTPVVFIINGIPWWYPLGGAKLAYPWPDLNYLDPAKALETKLGIGRVIGTVVYAGNSLIEPGVVQSAAAAAGTISIGDPNLSGDPNGARAARLASVGQMLEAAGYKAPIAADIRQAAWMKLVGSNLAAMPICTLLGKPLAVFSQNAELAALNRAMLYEGLAIAAAWGYVLPINPEGEQDPRLLTNPHKPSMTQDFERARMLEIDPILTAAQRMARAAGVPTPNFDAVMALLKQRASDAGLYIQLPRRVS
ncbi:MAG: ketopantoate reductase family protein [Burkholderiales bacterium]